MDGIPRLIAVSSILNQTDRRDIEQVAPPVYTHYPGERPWGVSLRRLGSDLTTLKEQAMGIIWTILIGFVAGVIAKFIMPGKNEPSGFVLTALLGIVGAVVASYLGRALGWYAPGEGAGLIGAVVGAIVVLFIWGLLAKRRA
jgi:uncharacterized membrane protein YeaQ/YmgE (transglycosylase-associated protein family)